MSASLLDTVAAIFADAQRSLATHRTSTKKLLELLNKPFHDCEESKCVIIDIVLQNCVDRVLVCTKKEPSVERVIKFICDVVIASITNCETPNADSLQISESRSEFDDFFTSSINHLLARTVSSNKVVRLRACEIIAGIMSSMKAETEVSDGIYSNMVKFLIPRLRDKVPGVRMWSIKAIGRLQNPLDDDDLVLSEIIRLMTCDASKDVRVAAVENVCICKRSLPALVERIKDIKSEVRVAALEHMAKDIDIRHLTVSMRAFIVRSGLNDRESSVVKATHKLILKWLEHNKIHKLFQLMNLQHHSKEAEMLGTAVLSEISSIDDASHSMSLQKNNILECVPHWDAGLTAISASDILWALLRCEYATAHYSPTAAALIKEKLIPDTIKLCGLLSEAHCPALKSNIQNQVAARYLFRMTAFLDASDVIGCTELSRICEAMIKDLQLPDSLVESVLSAWWRGSGLSLEECIDRVMDISRVVRSANPDHEVEGVNHDELSVASSIRGLLIIEWCLQRRIGGKNINRSATCNNFDSDFLLNSLQQPNMELRGLAVRCLGLLTLVSESHCDEHHRILFQAASMEREDPLIRSQAIQAITDMALIYESRFKDDNALINSILRLNESSNPELLRIAAESACKLVFAGRLTHPRLFANLLKFFFLPELVRSGDDEENDSTFLGSSPRLEQILAVFFQTYFVVNQEAWKFAAKAIPELVTDIGMLVRDGLLEANAILKVSSCLLILSDDMKVQGPIMDKMDEDGVALSAEEDEEETEHETVDTKGSEVKQQFYVRLAAAISREILKLGCNKQDKSIAKEYIKVLGILSPATWIDSPSTAMSVATIMNIIVDAVPQDKTVTKVFEAYMAACERAGKENLRPRGASEIISVADSGSAFLDIAPGLADLVGLHAAKSSDYVSNEVCLSMKENVASKTGNIKHVKSSIDSKGENVIKDVPVPNVSQRSVRSSKIAASLKIANQAAKELSI